MASSCLESLSPSDPIYTYIQCFGSGSFSPDRTFFPRVQIRIGEKSGLDSENSDRIQKIRIHTKAASSRKKKNWLITLNSQSFFGQYPLKSNQRTSLRPHWIVKILQTEEKHVLKSFNLQVKKSKWINYSSLYCFNQ